MILLSSNYLYYTTLPTPFGDFSLAVDAEGALAAAGFGGAAMLQARFPGGTWERDEERTAALRSEIDAYMADPHHRFAARIRTRGTPFQERVWEALRRIPVGGTRSYGEIAAELGSSPRAVGRANATNPVCLFVPCHRVIGSEGELTGYAFGEDLKRRLLEHEGALPPAKVHESGSSLPVPAT